GHERPEGPAGPERPRHQLVASEGAAGFGRSLPGMTACGSRAPPSDRCPRYHAPPARAGELRGRAVDYGRMRFGIFMAPFHPAGENPTLLLEQDVGLVEQLDRWGYDEAWIGEHHSAGSEIIASPEIFIAHCAARTRQIRLGTGVVSAAYHHPLWVAERAVLLDHLTRGRFMLGLGPGALPTDAAMIGLDMP